MTEELRALGSVRTRGVLLLAIVAIAAGAAGGAIDRIWVARDRHEVTGKEPRREPGMLRTDRTLEERRPVNERGGIPISLRSIDLTPDQKQRILLISSRYQPAAESVIAGIRARVLALDLKMRQEAMCVLTPKQRENWIAWRKRERLVVEAGDSMLKLVNSGACPK